MHVIGGGLYKVFLKKIKDATVEEHVSIYTHLLEGV
jgi:hypothetical protein